jgi:hypothetical protein
MICISPMATFFDRGRNLPPLSMCTDARFQCSRSLSE